jgi:hypothetical protein
MTFVKSESPWQNFFFFFTPGRSGISLSPFGKEFCFFHWPIWFFFTTDPPISSHITLLYPTLSSVCGLWQASEQASELYVAQQRPWAEAFPKLMGHPHSPALSAQYFGNAQALGHYPIL